MIKEAYPLQWPLGWKRTSAPKDSRFGSWNNKPSIASATNKIVEEMRLFGGKNLIISTDLKLKKDGFPYSNQRQPDNQGVAVYFNWKGNQKVIACDSFNKIGCNLWAIGKTIEAMRGIDRWGCSDILEKAFIGFDALPEHAGPSIGKRNWWDVLDVYRFDSKEMIKLNYKKLLKRYHPDNIDFGCTNKFLEVQQAWKEYEQLK